MESSGAEKVGGNTEMLWEILIRVPLKPLLRLNCVSKPWKALISDQQFRESHTLHHHQHKRYPNSLILTNGYEPPYIFSCTTTLKARVFDLDFLNSNTDFVVLRSCNGLLLCHLTLYPDPFFICNPITRDFTFINLSVHSHPSSRQGKTIHHYLAFDPSVSPFYKVVSLEVTLNSPLHWVFYVYAFKPPHSPPPPPPHKVSVSIPFALESDYARGVYCNGAIHWYNRGEFSVYFHVDSQCLKYYPMPLSNSEWLRLRTSPIFYFGHSGGRLHLMLPLKENLSTKSTFYDIFELKEDYSAWLLTHRIDLKSIRLQFTHMRPIFTYYIFHTKDKNNNSSSISLLIVSREGAIVHDPVNKTSTKLCDFQMGHTTVWNNLYEGRVLQHFDYLS